MRAPLRAATYPARDDRSWRFFDSVPYHGDMVQESCEPITVRMFPDYADTVLWLEGPVEYEESALSTELIRGLQEWEQSYYESLGADLEWESPSAAQAFSAVGTDLAARVTNELGAEFAIEFASYEDGEPTYSVRSRRPANNEEAAATFANIVSEAEVEQKRVARMLTDSGPDAQFTAVAPLSGEVFTLGGQGRRTNDAE